MSILDAKCSIAEVCDDVVALIQSTASPLMSGRCFFIFQASFRKQLPHSKGWRQHEERKCSRLVSGLNADMMLWCGLSKQYSRQHVLAIPFRVWESVFLLCLMEVYRWVRGML